MVEAREIEAIRALANELGLSDRIDFHSGFSGEEYVRELQRTDIYFLPSFRESTPVTLLEAYLAGCYPVVADTSAQGEIVRFAGGIAVPTHDMQQLIDGLANAIIGCHEKRHELYALSSQCLDKLLEYFDSGRYDEAVTEAYRMALGSSTAHPPEKSHQDD